MKKIKIDLANGTTVFANKIEDINTYRGFYVILKNGDIVKADFYTAGMEVKYHYGFNLNGKGLQQYLYDKLSAGEKLSVFEKQAFYDSVDLNSPIVRNGEHVVFNFRPLLCQVPYLEFYTLETKMSEVEREIFETTDFTAEDIYLDGLYAIKP